MEREARGVIRGHRPHFDHPLSGAVALVYVFRLRTALSGMPESSLVGVIHLRTKRRNPCLRDPRGQFHLMSTFPGREITVRSDR